MTTEKDVVYLPPDEIFYPIYRKYLLRTFVRKFGKVINFNGIKDYNLVNRLLLKSKPVIETNSRMVEIPLTLFLLGEHFRRPKNKKILDIGCTGSRFLYFYQLLVLKFGELI